MASPLRLCELGSMLRTDRSASLSSVAKVLSMLAGAHGTFLLHGDVGALDRARRGAEFLLAAYAGRRPVSD